MLLRIFVRAFLSAFALQTSRARRPRQPFRANFVVVELDVVRASQSRRCCFAAEHARGKMPLTERRVLPLPVVKRCNPSWVLRQTAVTFLQQRKLLRAGNLRALYPLRDWVWRVEKYGDNQIRTAIVPSEFVYVWLDVVWASLISETGTARLV